MKIIFISDFIDNNNYFLCNIYIFKILINYFKSIEIYVFFFNFKIIMIKITKNFVIFFIKKVFMKLFKYFIYFYIHFRFFTLLKFIMKKFFFK